MNKRLLEILICPRCLPDEIQLAEKITDIKGNDIINGELRCPGCGKIYFIENGIADLAPNPPTQALRLILNMRLHQWSLPIYGATSQIS